MFHIYKLFFLCDLVSDTPAQAQIDNQSASYTETGESAFFAEDDIPADLSIGRVTPPQIKRFFEHLRNPALPTDYD